MKKLVFVVLAVLLLAGCVPAGTRDTVPRTAVVSAFDSELQLLLDNLKFTDTEVITGHTFATGELAGQDVVLLLSGVSMENAAMSTQAVIDHYNVKRIVFSGIAGGVNPALHIGDVAVPAKWGLYQKQLFARADKDGWGLGWHDAPFGNFGMMFPQKADVFRACAGEPDELEERFWFPVDAEMLATARQAAARVDLAQCTSEGVCLEHEPKIKVGGAGVSGPTFVDNAKYRRWVYETFGADALDMETTAVGLVAYSNCVPYLAFRSLSDLAGGGEGENQIGTFFELAAENSAGVVLAWLEAWE